ncbi:MAG: hypothetical protein E7446_02130 [Ruminococcaceae bacterium]|nr:hypothetical protein [Oscillospiraceae bacterium]
MRTLYHDKPFSQGAENVIKRARQLADVRWTPVKPLPNALRSKGPEKKEYYYGYFSAWHPQTGLPYSSCRTVEKYIGWNVSLETYLSALRNPHSVLYTRELKNSPGTKANTYYGIVCSMYVSYALQLPYRVVCKDWPALPHVHQVDIDPLENLRLCDIMLEPKSHIGIITDIRRDADGKIYDIEVSESTLPLVVSNRFTPEEFQRFWIDDGYSVWRYDLVDEVTYTPDPFVYVDGDPEVAPPKINEDILPDFGNKANYRVGDEPVELCVLTEGWESIEVTDPAGKVTSYPAEEKLVLHPETVGIYAARLRRGDDYSDSVNWCMVNIDLSFEKEKFAFGEDLRIKFSNAAPDTVFYTTLNDDTYYVPWSGCLSEEEIASGTASIPAPTKPGLYYVLVMAKNNYGIYTSKYTSVIVE